MSEASTPTPVRWCFSCGREYVDEVDECPECAIPTVDQPPIDQSELEGDGDQLAYELHTWSVEGRVMLNGLLNTAGILHSWQGATLFVKEVDEAAVDELVEQTQTATLPSLDAALDHSVYSLNEMGDEHRTRLFELLTAADIAYEVNAEGDLVLHSADEDRAEEVFDEIDNAEIAFGPGIDGVNPADVVSDLFVAADRLRLNPRNHKGVLGFVEAHDLAVELQLPFGFDANYWRTVLERAADVRELLVDDGSSDDDVAAAASDLHALLGTHV